MSEPKPNRRQFLAASGLSLAAASSLAAPRSAFATGESPMHAGRIYKSLKFGMFNESGLSLAERFAILKELGFDGVELDAPGGPDKAHARAASEKTGLPIDGMVNNVHWQIRMSDPNPETRARSTEHMLEAIRQCKQCGGHTVLLVPGHGNDGSVEEVEQRALEEIRKCLPLCAELGVYIAIENVWNHMFYDHDGPADQSARRLADFIDRCNSPWVGVQFDIGNHQKYGKPAEWIRTLGSRIVKLDVKDWGKANGFCKIGDGDVDWNDVCIALQEIGYTGYAAAEVAGGDRKRMADIAQRMDRCLKLS